MPRCAGRIQFCDTADWKSALPAEEICLAPTDAPRSIYSSLYDPICRSLYLDWRPARDGRPLLSDANNSLIHIRMIPRLAKIRHVALDMDGTIYKGKTLFEATEPFLALLKDLGLGWTFLTNNPSKSITDYLKHLRQMGITAAEDQ